MAVCLHCLYAMRTNRQRMCSSVHVHANSALCVHSMASVTDSRGFESTASLSEASASFQPSTIVDFCFPAASRLLVSVLSTQLLMYAVCKDVYHITGNTLQLHLCRIKRGQACRAMCTAPSRFLCFSCSILSGSWSETWLPTPWRRVSNVLCNSGTGCRATAAVAPAVCVRHADLRQCDAQTEELALRSSSTSRLRHQDLCMRTHVQTQMPQ